MDVREPRFLFPVAQERPGFAGQFSPDQGTNVNHVAQYLSNFAGPNAAALNHRAVADWVRESVEHDRAADYYSFALNTTLPGSAKFIPAFRQASQTATVRLFPSFSRSHPERHDAMSSVGVIVIPAVSASGRLHFHGWIRMPCSASQTPKRLGIFENGVRIAIQAPEGLVTLVDTLVYDNDAPFNARSAGFTSLWIAHRDGQAVSTRTNGFGFKYLLKTADGELRMWSEAEFIPKMVFARVAEKTQAIPDGGARQLH